MPLATKSTRCPSCGAKNPPETTRCRLCTRTLPYPAPPGEAEFNEALYAQPVRTSSRRSARRSVLPLAVVLIAGLVTWNYFSLGYGPSWAHRPEAHAPGTNWRTFRGVPGTTAQLPGEPIIETVDSTVGFITRARVGVNGRWDAVLDATTRSAGARRDGLDQLAATLVIASTQPIADLEAAMPTLLATLVDGVTISDLSLDPLPAGSTTTPGYEVVATYRGYPARGDNGVVRARVATTGATTTVAATLSADTNAVSIQDRLVDGLSPGGDS